MGNRSPIARALATVTPASRSGRRCERCHEFVLETEAHRFRGRDYCAKDYAHAIDTHARQWVDHVADVEQRVVIAAGGIYAKATVADFPKPISAKCLELFGRVVQGEQKPAGLLIVGPVGTGKTYLAAAMLRLWVGLTLQTFAFNPARSLFRQIRETYGPGATSSESDIIEDRIERGLLVLDDLGREGRITGAVMSFLHEILDARLRHERFTIVTTNLGDDLGQVYGEAIASRLATYEVIVLRGEDRRRCRSSSPRPAGAPVLRTTEATQRD